MDRTRALCMTHFNRPALWAAVTLAPCMFLWRSSAARAQDIEPRSYSNAPVGVDFLIAG